MEGVRLQERFSEPQGLKESPIPSNTLSTTIDDGQDVRGLGSIPIPSKRRSSLPRALAVLTALVTLALFSFFCLYSHNKRQLLGIIVRRLAAEEDEDAWDGSSSHEAVDMCAHSSDMHSQTEESPHASSSSFAHLPLHASQGKLKRGQETEDAQGDRAAKRRRFAQSPIGEHEAASSYASYISSLLEVAVSGANEYLDGGPSTERSPNGVDWFNLLDGDVIAGMVDAEDEDALAESWLVKADDFLIPESPIFGFGSASMASLTLGGQIEAVTPTTHNNPPRSHSSPLQAFVPESSSFTSARDTGPTPPWSGTAALRGSKSNRQSEAVLTESGSFGDAVPLASSSFSSVSLENSGRLRGRTRNPDTPS
ncbi:hypothetical protein Esti_000430 [Eimeria stiedai]